MPQGAENGEDIVRYPSRMSITDLSPAEFEALRATIRERGTARLYVVIAGLASWSALAIALLAADLVGSITLAPLLVLAATFEINFFVHTGVERIGRYIQVFYEERAATNGWETTAMNYGTTFAAAAVSIRCSRFFFSQQQSSIS